jgi:transcription antitermination factor NusG
MSIYSELECSQKSKAPLQLATKPNGCHWYVVCVRLRYEKAAASALREKQYEEYVPLYCKRNRWSDRIKDVYLPLFPGYVFCHGDLLERPSLVTTPGVLGILRFGHSPAIVTDLEIESIRTAINSGLYAEPWPYLRDGQRILIEHGALTGLEGILISLKNRWRVVLSIEALCRSIALEIDREWAVPIPSPRSSNCNC